MMAASTAPNSVEAPTCRPCAASQVAAASRHEAPRAHRHTKGTRNERKATRKNDADNGKQTDPAAQGYLELPITQ